MLQSSKHSGAKTEFNAKWLFKVIQGHVFCSQWKCNKALSNTKYQCRPYLLRFRRCSVYERSAVFFADSKYSADHGPLQHISVGTCVKRLYSKCNLTAETRFVMVNIYRKMVIGDHSNVIYFVVSGKTIRHKIIL